MKDFSDKLTLYHQKEDGCSGQVYRYGIDWFQDEFKCSACDWHTEIPNEN